MVNQSMPSSCWQNGGASNIQLAVVLYFFWTILFVPHSIYIGQAVAEEEQERMEKRKTDDALRKEEDIHVMMRLSHKGESFLPGDITLRCGGVKERDTVHISISILDIFSGQQLGQKQWQCITTLYENEHITRMKMKYGFASSITLSSNINCTQILLHNDRNKCKTKLKPTPAS